MRSGWRSRREPPGYRPPRLSLGFQAAGEAVLTVTTIARVTSRSAVAVVVVATLNCGIAPASADDPAAPPAGRSLVCKLPPKAKKLPADRAPRARPAPPAVPDGATRHGTSARAGEVRPRGTRLGVRTRALARPAAVVRAGYDTRTRPRKAGDSRIHYFHAERSQEPRRAILNPRRPKALIYANAPGRPLVLVGAMWSTRRGERGPTPAGPIMRWHSHVICSDGVRRGLKPPANGVCPAGTRLRQGRSEMLHVWFTGELRSAFAIRAPEPELCAAGHLPRDHCR